MDVLLCTACGHRLTEPLRLVPEVPPHPEYDGLKNPDGPRTMVSRGPRGTLVVNPEDARERLSGNPDVQESGCCGALGTEGPNQVCGGCGAAVATWHSECYGPWEIRFLPDAVRVASA